MSTLWRKAFRDLLATRWQTGGLALLVAVVVALMAGAGRARDMMVMSRDMPLALHNAAHLDIRCSPTLPDVLRDVRDLPGIAAMEERMLLDGVMRAPDTPATPAVIRVLPASTQPLLFALEILEGRRPETGEEAVLVDRSVRAHRGIEVGDEIELQVLGVRRTWPVVGVVFDVEHLLNPAHPDFEVPIPGALAAIYVSEAAAKHLPYADRIDSLLFRFDPDTDHAAMADALRERLPVSVLAMIPAEKQSALRMSKMIVGIFDIYMPTVATILIAVALALFVITISRLVRRQRPQIGTLLAIGQRPSAIALSMLGSAIVPVLIGGVLGGLVHGRIAWLIYDAHANAIGWPPLIDPGPGPEVIVTSLIAAAIAVVACMIPVLGAARQRPARLLRQESWDTLYRARGVLAGIATKLRRLLRLPLHVVLGISTVVRRRWATATAAIALGANMAVVLAFLFVHISHNREVQKTFNRLGLDAVAYFNHPLPSEAIAEANRGRWSKVEPLITRIAWLELPDGTEFVRVTCLEDDGWIAGFPFGEGRAFSTDDAAELYVDRWHADDLGLAVGDRVRCYPYYNAPEGIDLEVAGIFEGVSLGLMVLPLETGRALYELPELSTGVHVSSDLPREELLASLHDIPDVASVVYLGDARQHVEGTFSGARFVLMLAVTLAVIVAVIFLGILASLDASERARDFAILRALGWKDGKVIGLCVTEVVARGYLAILLAIPAAPFIARGILARVQEANHYRMPLHDPYWMYAGLAALAAVLIPLSAYPAWRVAQAIAPSRIARVLGRE